MGLILDSSMVIAAERRGDIVEQLIDKIVKATGDQKAALSANWPDRTDPRPLSRANSVLVVRFGDLAIIQRESPIIGPIPNWNRDSWQCRTSCYKNRMRISPIVERSVF